jgi:hypothetical protein
MDGNVEEELTDANKFQGQEHSKLYREVETTTVLVSIRTNQVPTVQDHDYN